MNRRMTIVLIILSMVAALSLGVSTTINAQGVKVGRAVKVTAEVVAIDRVDRTVVLLGSKGNVVEVEVGHEARDFDQIEVGDQIKVEYYESVALFLGKKGAEAEGHCGAGCGTIDEGG